MAKEWRFYDAGNAIRKVTTPYFYDAAGNRRKVTAGYFYDSAGNRRQFFSGVLPVATFQIQARLLRADDGAGGTEAIGEGFNIEADIGIGSGNNPTSPLVVPGPGGVGSLFMSMTNGAEYQLAWFNMPVDTVQGAFDSVRIPELPSGPTFLTANSTYQFIPTYFALDGSVAATNVALWRWSYTTRFISNGFYGHGFNGA